MKPIIALLLSIITIMGVMLFWDAKISEQEKQTVYATGVLFGMMKAYHQTSSDPDQKAHYLQVGAENALYGWRVENGKFKSPDEK